MDLLRMLPFLVLALLVVPTAWADEKSTKGDTDELNITGTVVEVKKDGTIVIEALTGKAGDPGTKKVRLTVKTDNNTQFSILQKAQPRGGGNQSQGQFTDVKKGNTINCNWKRKKGSNINWTNWNSGGNWLPPNNPPNNICVNPYPGRFNFPPNNPYNPRNPRNPMLPIN